MSMMSNKLKYYLPTITSSIVAILIASASFGQTYGAVPNIMAPDVASLGKAGAYPVSYYTGSPGITVPLYALKENGISVDLSLQYDAAGFVPNKEDGIVGLNWSLESGGIITRTVNWSADDKNTGETIGNELNTNKGYIYGMLNAGLGTYSKEYIRQLSFLSFDVSSSPATALAYEYSPDIFSFNFNGHSGMFFLGNDGTVKVVSEKNYKVDLTNFAGQNDVCDCQYSEIAVTTDDGTVYKFGGEINALDITYPYTDNNARYISCKGTINAWRLKSVQTSNGTLITYQYEPQSELDMTFAEAHGVNTGIDYAYEKIFLNERVDIYTGSQGSSNNSTVNLRSRVLIKTCYLSKITTPTETVDFSYIQKANRFYPAGETMYNSNRTKLLDKIIVKNLEGIPVKDFWFSYDVFGSASAGYRYFLDKTKFVNSLDNTDQYFNEFSYYKTNSLPDPLTKGIDLWGYYNGSPNSALLPTTSSGSPNYEVTFTGRSANTSFSDIGLLEKIYHPTGGWTEFKYEGHTYNRKLKRKVSGGITPEWITGSGTAGGLRIKEINESSGVSKKYYYTQNYTIAAPGTVSTGILVEPNIYLLDHVFYYNGSGNDRYVEMFDNNIAASASYSESPIGYSEVVEVSGEGYTKYFFSTHETNPDKYSLGTDSYISKPNTDNSFSNYSQQLKRLVMHSSCNTERSKLLRTEAYDQTDRPIKKIVNKYNEDPLRYDQSVIGFNFPYASSNWGFYHSYALYYFHNAITQQDVTDYDPDHSTSLTTTTIYKYRSNSSPVVIEMDEINSKNETFVTQYKYPPDFPSTLPYTTMVSRHMLAPLIEESKSRNLVSPVFLKSVKTQYKDWGNNIITPEFAQTKELSAATQTRFRYHAYDNRGNILSASKENDLKSAYIWDNTKSYLVATIINAEPAHVDYTSFEAGGIGNWTFAGTPVTDHSTVSGKKVYYLKSSSSITKTGLDASKIYFITYWSKNAAYTITGTQASWPKTIKTLNGWTCYEHKLNSGTTSVTISGTGFIDELRLYPENAQMATYCYEPLKGITASIDPNHNLLFYNYDGYGRLLMIRDENKKIEKKFCYNYTGQTENCSLFGNVQKSGVFTAGCPVNFTGSLVTYIVPANTYFSATQANADVQAQNDVTANGQNYADVTGSCTALTIYAKIVLTDIYNDIDYSTANVWINFYSNAACTIPVSVSNLTVNYKKDRTYCSGGTMPMGNYSVVCSGTQMSLGSQIISSDDGIHCYNYSFSVTSGAGYTPK